jgi:transcriptional regulator with XRE-family HTH domain
VLAGRAAREDRCHPGGPVPPENVTVNEHPLSTDLGELLRAWRERLTPEDVGLEPYGRRRTPGLRREEVAQLAGVSVDYVTRLEQGRFRTPSAQVAAALARALQLSRSENDLLHRVAGIAPPSAGTVTRHVPPGVQRMVSRLSAFPVAVFAADWSLLYSTSLWQRLFHTPSVIADPGQNLLVQTFIDDSIAEIATAHGGSDRFERALVADLRRSVGLLDQDVALHTFVADIRARSPRFDRLWGDAQAAAHTTLTKTVHNRVVGDVVLDCDVVVVPDTDVKIVLYSTTSTGPNAEKLDFLRVAAITAFP